MKKMDPIIAMHLETGHRQVRRNLCRNLGMKWADFKKAEGVTIKKDTAWAANAAESASEKAARNPGNPWLQKAAKFTAGRLGCLLSIQGRLYG